MNPGARIESYIIHWMQFTSQKFYPLVGDAENARVDRAGLRWNIDVLADFDKS